MPPQKYRHWFDTGDGMGPVTDNNRTSFFVTGEKAFADIGEMLDFQPSREAEAFFLGWSMDLTTRLRPKLPTPDPSTLYEHLGSFAARGGIVRAMLWDNSIFDNGRTQEAARLISRLRNGKAILDGRTPVTGAHHQKIQAFVSGPLTEKPGIATAYCGGMDLYADRVGSKALHDVHCKVVGDGAGELVNVFLERWNDHPRHGTDLTPSYRSAGPKNGTDLVQVCRTYPRFSPSEQPLQELLAKNKDLIDQILGTSEHPRPGDMSDNGTIRPYGFYDPSKGVQQIGRAVHKAITEAKKYIYLEDQYLTHKWIGQILAKKLKDSEKDFRLVILVLYPASSDSPQTWLRKYKVMEELRFADPGQRKWRLFSRRSDRPYSYVHSKTWIFDDELVITGSANADRRGYTHNSEANVVVAGDLTGTRRSSYGATTVAQDLRCRLFAKHLGQRPHFYLNPKHGLARWFGPVNNTNVEPLDVFSKKDDPDEKAAGLEKLAEENTTTGRLAAEVVQRMKERSGSIDNFLWDYVYDPDPDVPNP